MESTRKVLNKYQKSTGKALGKYYESIVKVQHLMEKWEMREEEKNEKSIKKEQR